MIIRKKYLVLKTIHTKCAKLMATTVYMHAYICICSHILNEWLFVANMLVVKLIICNTALNAYVYMTTYGEQQKQQASMEASKQTSKQVKTTIKTTKRRPINVKLKLTCCDSQSVNFRIVRHQQRYIDICTPFIP